VSLVLNAGELPVSSRLEHWMHLLDESVGPLDLRTGALGARDQVRVGDLGAVRVAELSTGEPGVASRTMSHIRKLDRDVCKVDVVVEGHGVVEQDGRQARVGPGDLTFVDLSRPVRWAMSPMRFVAVIFPRPLLAQGLAQSHDATRKLTGVSIGGDRGSGALVSSVARQLPGRLADCAPVEAARLGTAMLDLLTVALASRLDRLQAMRPEARHRALLAHVHAFIDAHLADPDLSPAAIAAANHVSLRQLYKLFAGRGVGTGPGTGVAGWIRQRRLERCRRDLLDPAWRHLPVSGIGARWGLPDPAHFSRAFRAAYGMSPTELRASQPLTGRERQERQG
jgi:AraC-like DNA-binding protein